MKQLRSQRMEKVAGREVRSSSPCNAHPDVDVGRLPLSPPKQLQPVIGQQLWPRSNHLLRPHGTPG